jgi:hypothetical protein
MNVSVTRSGGIAGLTRTWVVSIDDQPDREEWIALIGRVPWTHGAPSSRQPDRYVYEIRCRRHHARVPEQQLTGAWRELVDRVTEIGDPVADPR